MLKRIHLWLFLGAFGCAKVQPEVSSYFDLNALLDKQPAALAQKYQLEKEVIIDGVSEKKTLKLDSIQWAEELSLIRDFSITDPAMTNAYEETSSGTVVVYKPKENEQVEVASFIVDQSSDNMVITAERVADKAIYIDIKNLRLTIKNGLLESYYIKGFQKMVMKDTVHYEIAGVVH